MKTKEKKQNRNFIVINLGVILMLIALAISSVASAQPGGRQQGQPKLPDSKQIKSMVADLSKELSLSEKQETQITKMYVAHFDEVKKITKAGRPDRDKMETMKTAFEKEINAVLSKEQQNLFAEYQRKNQRKQR